MSQEEIRLSAHVYAVAIKYSSAVQRVYPLDQQAQCKYVYLHSLDSTALDKKSLKVSAIISQRKKRFLECGYAL